MQEAQRLNVAITRAINAMFVVVDIDAATSEVLLSTALESKDELDLDIEDIDIEKLNQAQKHLKNIIEYYIAEGCVKSVDIKQLSSQYISFDESNEFAVEQLKVKCFRCQQTGHTKWQCPNDQVQRRPKQNACKVCTEEGHMARECPQQTCCNCDEIRHSSSECKYPPGRNLTCNNCNRKGQVRKDCTMPKRAWCRICNLKGHTAATCPQKKCFRCGLKDHDAS